MGFIISTVVVAAAEGRWVRASLLIISDTDYKVAGRRTRETVQLIQSRSMGHLTKIVKLLCTFLGAERWTVSGEADDEMKN